MSKNCALSFKKDKEGFCNTIVNGKLRVKQTARIEKTLAVENNLQVYNDANIGDTVNTCNITIKNQLIYSEPELIDESGETLSQLKSLSFINTNGTGVLEDGCCNGLYKQIIKINDQTWYPIDFINEITSGQPWSIKFNPITGEGPYIAGDNLKSIAGITGLDRVAKWDGTKWAPIGNLGDIPLINSSSFPSYVRIISFSPNGDGPYIGGNFSDVSGITGLNLVAKWTGSSWTSVGNTGDFSNSDIVDINFDTIGNIYVAGGSISVAGITGLDYLAKYDVGSSSWTSVGNTGDFNGKVLSITFGPSGDGPYIGGQFTSVDGITGLDKIAKWTGSSWTSVGNIGDINNGRVESIAFNPITGDGPYVAGNFQNVAGITGLDDLALFDGSGWTSIGNTGDFNNTIFEVTFDNNGEGPYVCDTFTDVAGITGLDRLAKWTGSSWTSIGNLGDISNGAVRSIEFDKNNILYIGGGFSDIAGITGLNKLAKYLPDYKLTYNDTETLTLTNKGDEATLVYNTNPTNSWIKLT